MRTKKVINCKAFSFIEVMLSVAVLAVGIVGVIPLLATGMNATNASRDQEIAVLLAQEGVELIRNVRDNNWANGDDSFKSFPSVGSTDCRIDYTYNGGNISCSGASNALNVSSDFYRHGSGTLTKFQRKILIDVTSSQATVTSEVTWASGFPPNHSSGSPVDYKNCNTSSQCAYTTVILSKWGEQ